jgi:hypothetical protein
VRRPKLWLRCELSQARPVGFEPTTFGFEGDSALRLKNSENPGKQAAKPHLSQFSIKVLLSQGIPENIGPLKAVPVENGILIY